MVPLWSLRVIAGVAYTSLAGLAWVNATILQSGTVDGITVSIVPTISLIAVIGAAVTVGAMFQRVRDVERRVRELEDEKRWSGVDRRKGDA